MQYISSFNIGLEKIICRIIESELANFFNYKIEKGIVLYRSENKIETNNNLMFFNTYEICDTKVHPEYPSVQGLIFYEKSYCFQCFQRNNL